MWPVRNLIPAERQKVLASYPGGGLHHIVWDWFTDINVHSPIDSIPYGIVLRPDDYTVRSICSGTVIEAGRALCEGYVVLVRQDARTIYRYTDIEQLNVNVGDRISRGAVIGHTSNVFVLQRCRYLFLGLACFHKYRIMIQSHHYAITDVTPYALGKKPID